MLTGRVTYNADDPKVIAMQQRDGVTFTKTPSRVMNKLARIVYFKRMEQQKCMDFPIYDQINIDNGGLIEFE